MAQVPGPADRRPAHGGQAAWAPAAWRSRSADWAPQAPAAAQAARRPTERAPARQPPTDRRGPAGARPPRRWPP
eukprot:9445443-Alexandrium_andersonii.AAC.1